MTIEMIVALIGASIVAYVIADRFRLIAPVLLIAAGVVVAFIPFEGEMTLPSTVVLTIFLPILLYWESLSVSLNRMRRSLRGIILSATVLVAITAALIALITGIAHLRTTRQGDPLAWTAVVISALTLAMLMLAIIFLLPVSTTTEPGPVQTVQQSTP